jgi:hypothetical protein
LLTLEFDVSTHYRSRIRPYTRLRPRRQTPPCPASDRARRERSD